MIRLSRIVIKWTRIEYMLVLQLDYTRLFIGQTEH